MCVGYIVISGLKAAHGVQGLQVLVQSMKVSSFVERRIEAFLHRSHVRVSIFGDVQRQVDTCDDYDDCILYYV